MEAWIDCGAAFIKADVIRWKEGVFEGPVARSRKKRKATRLGEREVIAEVINAPDARGFVTLLVRACHILSVKDSRKALILKNATEIRRQQKTLLKGGVERLKWSDETARAVVASRFLNPPHD